MLLKASRWCSLPSDFYIGHSSSLILIQFFGSAIVYDVYFTEICSYSCMFISVISTPVQSSFSSLQGDISQRMASLMNGVSSQEEKMTELERRIQKVNISLWSRIQQINEVDKILFANNCH